MFSATIRKRLYAGKKKRKIVSWYFQVELPKDPDGRRRRLQKTGFSTEATAKAAAAKAIAKLMEDSNVLPDDLKLGELMRRYLAQAEISRKTRFRYEQLFEGYINPGLGQIEVQKLTSLEIEGFYARLRESGSLRNREGRPVKGLGARTVRHAHVLLSSTLAAAVNWRLIPSNPAGRGRVKVPRLEKTRVVCPDARSVGFLLGCMAGTDLYLPSLISSQVGLRRGEVLGLQWGDLDFETGVMHVSRSVEQVRRELQFKSTKSGPPRDIKMPKGLVAALRAHQQDQSRKREMFGPDYRRDLDLVVARPDGSIYPPDTLSADFGKFMAKIGRRDLTFHRLRHGYASVQLSGGTSVVTVAAVLGHSKPAMTLNVYSHVLAGDQERAAELMDRLYSLDQNPIQEGLRQ